MPYVLCVPFGLVLHFTIVHCIVSTNNIVMTMIMQMMMVLLCLLSEVEGACKKHTCTYRGNCTNVWINDTHAIFNCSCFEDFFGDRCEHGNKPIYSTNRQYCAKL